MKHRTKNGREIDIKDMEGSHLINTIKFIERKAKEGVYVETSVGGTCGDDFYYDLDVITGRDALEALNHKEYTDELNKRGLAIK